MSERNMAAIKAAPRQNEGGYETVCAAK